MILARRHVAFALTSAQALAQVRLPHCCTHIFPPLVNLSYFDSVNLYTCALSNTDSDNHERTLSKCCSSFASADSNSVFNSSWPRLSASLIRSCQPSLSVNSAVSITCRHWVTELLGSVNTCIMPIDATPATSAQGL